jgi:hypothetical protein
MDRVFLVSETGSLFGLWDDTIDFRELGECDVQRASSVEYSKPEQIWEARLPNGERIAAAPCREEVLAAEVAWIQERLEEFC